MTIFSYILGWVPEKYFVDFIVWFTAYYKLQFTLIFAIVFAKTKKKKQNTAYDVDCLN